ncbi:MAG: hypothetical protein AAGI22_09150 [Planctomycetota bacterium]
MHASRSALAPLALALLALALASPPAASPAGPPVAETESEVALGAGRRAAERGDAARARVHFERAAASDDPGVRADALLGMEEIARANGDVDALARAALGWADLQIGGQGRPGQRPPRGAFDLGKDGPPLLALAGEIAGTRVGAVAELTKAAADRESKGGRRPEQLLTAAWARRFALDLAQRSPAVLSAFEARLAPEVHAPRDAHGPVLKALERVAEKALSSGQPGLAARAARIIHGFGVQADFTHLRGDRPAGLARWRSKGAELLGRARARLRDDGQRPWTVEELEWLASDEGEAFTREHPDFGAPGVAVSPRGWYRIESDCGYQTLLGVASTIEDHHVRIAGYFGSDPFTDGDLRQGLVRIVPDPSGLEAEGAPFFWAGGFQSGDTTVMRHSVGTIVGLGRGLTHELTHRFDGALHGGIPSWLAEGRAVWTGAAYARTDDTTFVDAWCNFGTMRTVLRRGLANRKELEGLVKGEPEDYRSNYSVGNALYVFLSTWFPGDATSFTAAEPIFADRLREYEDSGEHSRRPSDRLEEFEDAFCDGEGGRPSSFDEFQEMFVEFLQGFDRREPAKWTARYVNSHENAERGEWVYDEPTWTWDWTRAEPLFGQNQARIAGLFLLEEGDRDAALRALVWARAVDGYDRRTSDGLLELFGAERKPSAARREALWVTEHERRGEPFASALEPAASGPFPARMPAVEAHLTALREGATTLHAAGAPRAADRLALEASRVAAWLGTPADVAPEGAPTPTFDDELVGWADEELTRLDEDRPKELFGFEEDGGILLGRRVKRGGSGRFDRRGGGKSFVRASRWMLPGSYSVRTNVRFTTAYNTAVAVVGWTSRERNVRLQITAGDWAYAVGDKDEEPRFDSVRWGFDGMRTRDAGLPGSARGGAIVLGSSSTSVTLELLVEGAAVSAWIAGQYAGTYHTIDGAPIEGFVGFGTSNGAVRLAPPIVRRTDGEPARVATARASANAATEDGTAPLDLSALDLERGTGPSFDRLENQRVHFGAERSTAPNGTLVLWVPSRSKSDAIRGLESREDSVGVAVKRAKRSARSLLQRMMRRDVVQPLVVVLPERYRPAMDVGEFEADLAEGAADGIPLPRVAFHSVVARPPADDEEQAEESNEEAHDRSIDQGRRWLMFLDPSDVVRDAVPWIGSSALENSSIDHWLTVFRDHGRPERPLPSGIKPRTDDEDDDAGER